MCFYSSLAGNKLKAIWDFGCLWLRQWQSLAKNKTFALQRERARVEERDRESIARIECKHRKSSDPPPSACSLTKQGHQGFGSTTQNKQSWRYLTKWRDDIIHWYQIAINCQQTKGRMQGKRSDNLPLSKWVTVSVRVVCGWLILGEKSWEPSRCFKYLQLWYQK